VDLVRTYAEHEAGFTLVIARCGLRDAYANLGVPGHKFPRALNDRRRDRLPCQRLPELILESHHQGLGEHLPWFAMLIIPRPLNREPHWTQRLLPIRRHNTHRRLREWSPYRQAPIYLELVRTRGQVHQHEVPVLIGHSPKWGAHDDHVRPYHRVPRAV